VEPVAVAAPVHQATGELVDDHHLAVLDHVVDIQFEEGIGLEGLFHMVDQFDVPAAVEVVQVKQLLDLLDALRGQKDGPVPLVDDVVAVPERVVECL
jgi:hypothetical protein